MSNSSDVSIGPEEVRRIAKLARLTIADGDVECMASDMSKILHYVHKLSELDTAQVEPTAHAVELPTKLRDDVVVAGLPVEVGLRDAPERLGDGFGVPKIIE